MSLSSFVAAVENDFQIAERDVWNFILKAQSELQAGEQKAVQIIDGGFAWIQAHQQDILTTFQAFLTDAAAIGSVIPETAPEVAVATTAIDAATAAVDILSKGITNGSTPISTFANAYSQVKAAASAVSTVIKSGTAPAAS